MRRLDISKPAVSDRIIGFTIPSAETFYICDHDEVWRAQIGASPSLEVTDDAPYEFVASREDFLGLVLHGARENPPVLRVGQNEIAYDFAPGNDFAIVSYTLAGQAGQIKFRTLSGDWFAASLSHDGRHLVLADPYDLAVYAVT